MPNGTGGRADGAIGAFDTKRPHAGSDMLDTPTNLPPTDVRTGQCRHIACLRKRKEASMSKRAERKRKKAEQRSKTIRDAALVLVFGLVLLGLGIFGIRSNGRELREYQGSSDIRTVEAMIVSVSVHDDPTQDEETGGLPRYVWDATLEFRVDDSPAYTDFMQFDHEVAVGDMVKVKVFQRSDGTYALPLITNSTGSFLSNIPMIIAMVVGGFIALAATVVLIDAIRGTS